MKIIAIDPGLAGGIAIKLTSGNIKIMKMPLTAKDLYETLKPYKNDSYCFLEKVFGKPGRGASSMFNFGKGFGWLEMALIALQIPTEEVTPQRWIKHHGLGTKGDMTDTQWKNKLKMKAQQFNPSINVALWNSDALLILKYGEQTKK